MQELSLKLSNYNKNQYKNFIENEPLDQLHSLKLYLDDLYYNTDQCIFSDIKYDTLKDILLKRDPKYIPPVGCKIRTHDNRIDLPFWLGSATKITPNEEKELDRWLSKNKCKDFIVTEKLDGVSGMFIQTNGKRYLYTRGDGLVGANISYLIQYINIPSFDSDISVRGELIIEKKIFDDKYKHNDTNKNRTYKHSRNMIAGIVGAKTIREGLYDIKFIVYEIIGDKTMPSPLDQLEKLESLKFTTAMYEKVNNISIPKLEELHKKFKSKTKFEIDGIIIQSNVQYDRNITGNPSYLFAFKINSVDGIVETTVLDIEWNVSKWGQIIPVALIDPVELPGVTISRVTLSNAGLMVEKKIGPGAIVNVTRSKDVIPFIVDVVIACNDDELKFPHINYSWDENKVHLIINEDNIEPEVLADMRIKLFASFFEKMGIKHVSHQTLKKIYEAGFDTLLKIIGMSKEELMTIDTFKDKSSTRIIDNIKKGLQEVNVCDLLGASSVLGYGMGRKKVKSLMTDIPDILSCNRKNLKERILKIEGFSEITTQKVIENLDYAIEFIDEVSKYVTYMKDSRVSNELVGTKFVFSGFRSKDIETDIQNKGGSVSTSVSKKTTALIVSDKSDKNTSKFLKANECGVPIYSKEEFLTKYFS
jgi:DNA ligase (NAD+)